VAFKGVIVAVVLRLARLGKHKSPAYRVVATDKQNKRDGKFLEVVGTYNPVTSPAQVSLKEDRIKKWLNAGALPTEVVRSLIKRSLPGVIEAREEHKKKKIQEARRQRKERTAKSGGAKSSAKKAKAAK
jgi:small subunit ribosomal protein S16